MFLLTVSIRNDAFQNMHGVEKTSHIEAIINGTGSELIFYLIKERYPQAQIFNEEEKALP